MNMATLDRQLATHDILVVLLPSGTYVNRMTDVVKAGTKGAKSLCYVSLNKPAATISEALRKKHVDLKKIVFIDAFSTVQTGNSIPINSPRAMTETSIAISKLIEDKKIDRLIVDSLSTLLVYEQPDLVVKFSHAIITTGRATKVKCLLVLLKEDADTTLLKDLAMFADAVVTIR